MRRAELFGRQGCDLGRHDQASPEQSGTVDGQDGDIDGRAAGTGLGFTTTRVADEADISVGSLYQYFPNKHALAVAIHDQHVQQGWQHVSGILTDPDKTPGQRLIEITRWFFETEAYEADQLGEVVGDLDVFLHHRSVDDELDAAVAAQLSTALGLDPDATRYVMTVIESVGKATAALRLDRAGVASWAERTATLLTGHYGLS
jgi:AcrR family transcriptional regulator